jgi:hypothetical protein
MLSVHPLATNLNYIIYSGGLHVKFRTSAIAAGMALIPALAILGTAGKKIYGKLK